MTAELTALTVSSYANLGISEMISGEIGANDTFYSHGNVSMQSYLYRMFADYFSFKIICAIREKRGYKHSITSFLSFAFLPYFLHWPVGRWSKM